MERKTTLVGRGSGITHSFERSRWLGGAAGALALTIAEPSVFCPALETIKGGARPRAPGTGL
jgi:hypothetical protein